MRHFKEFPKLDTAHTHTAEAHKRERERALNRMLPSYNSDAYSNVKNVFVYSVAVSVFVGLSVNVFV